MRKNTINIDLISHEIDTLFQDELFAILRNIAIDQTIELTYVDGKSLASLLLQARHKSSTRFLSVQSDLIYGSGEKRDLIRPMLIETSVLVDFLSAHGFEIISVVTEDSELPRTRVTIKKVRNARLPSTKLADTDLPIETSGFYSGKQVKKRPRSMAGFPEPRILNIGSGSDPKRQLPNAINLDISPSGSPDVLADATRLPFPDNYFSMVMASHILEHFPVSLIPSVIDEWLRVLHPKGLLRIAVPDADKALPELVSGQTSKGGQSYSLPGGSAPLTQLTGLGSEHSKTDPRWRHQVLFSKELLGKFLQKKGFEVVSQYRSEEALSLLAGIKTDETNRYSLKIEAMAQRKPHQVTLKANDNDYESAVSLIKKSGPIALTILVPVKNEESVLNTFFPSLKASLADLSDASVKTEVVFVVNGSTDQSAKLLSDFKSSYAQFDIRIVESKEGIYKAFVAGTKAATLKGMLSKIDVDTEFDSWTLPLMIADLIRKPERQVTYAEVVPREPSPTRFNMGEFYQEFRTERLYYHGRLSLYRKNPFTYFPEKRVSETNVLVEDIVLSSLFAYYFGLDSMGPAEGASVMSSQPTSFDKSLRKFDRAQSEVEKINAVFPHLSTVRSILDRTPTTPPLMATRKNSNHVKNEMWNAYYQLHQAMIHVSKLNDGTSKPVTDWERLRD